MFIPYSISVFNPDKFVKILGKYSDNPFWMVGKVSILNHGRLFWQIWRCAYKQLRRHLSSFFFLNIQSVIADILGLESRK